MDELPRSPPPMLAWTIRVVLWLLLAAVGAATVLGYRAGGWGGVALSILGAVAVVGLAGGLVGVSCVSCWMMVWASAGVFQGIYWGATLYGWPGAILGAPLGGLAGMLSAVAPMVPIAMIASFMIEKEERAGEMVVEEKAEG